MRSSGTRKEEVVFTNIVLELFFCNLQGGLQRKKVPQTFRAIKKKILCNALCATVLNRTQMVVSWLKHVRKNVLVSFEKIVVAHFILKATFSVHAFPIFHADKVSTSTVSEKTRFKSSPIHATLCPCDI